MRLSLLRDEDVMKKSHAHYLAAKKLQIKSPGNEINMYMLTVATANLIKFKPN